MTIKTMIFTHRPCVSFTRFTVCWWRHNLSLMTSQWPSNSLNIDFINSDIHGLLCNKECNFPFTPIPQWWFRSATAEVWTWKRNYMPHILCRCTPLTQASLFWYTLTNITNVHSYVYIRIWMWPVLFYHIKLENYRQFNGVSKRSTWQNF